MDSKNFRDYYDSVVRSKKTQSKDYEGYKMIEDAKLSREEIRAAIKILEELLLTGDREDMYQKYLFPKGFLLAKKTVDQAQKDLPDFPPHMADLFEKQYKGYVQKIKDVKPLLDLIFKLKEVI